MEFIKPPLSPTPLLATPLLEQVPGLTFHFETREKKLKDSLDPEQFTMWEQTRPQWKQVHGTQIAHVTKPGQNCGEVDALWTRRPGQALAIATADCVPILLAREDGGAIAAIHAGWRGTYARIVSTLALELKSHGENLSQWVACIGPSIGPCCYEVSPELSADFERTFGEAALAPNQRRHLDLPQVNRLQLQDAGIERVDQMRLCTFCARDPAQGTPLFHSYRRGKDPGRQLSYIGVRRDAV
jgi:YfiH family protein